VNQPAIDTKNPSYDRNPHGILSKAVKQHVLVSSLWMPVTAARLDNDIVSTWRSSHKLSAFETRFFTSATKVVGDSSKCLELLQETIPNLVKLHSRRITRVHD
jgi:hypothetical protein